MTEMCIPRVFQREEKQWTVRRCAASGSRKETGLHFVHGQQERFLVFTRGALPNEKELQTMSEEVLAALLDRAGARSAP